MKTKGVWILGIEILLFLLSHLHSHIQQAAQYFNCDSFSMQDLNHKIQTKFRDLSQKLSLKFSQVPLLLNPFPTAHRDKVLSFVILKNNMKHNNYIVIYLEAQLKTDCKRNLAKYD